MDFRLFESFFVFDAPDGVRQRSQPLFADFLAAFLADSVSSLFELAFRLIHFYEFFLPDVDHLDSNRLQKIHKGHVPRIHGPFKFPMVFIPEFLKNFIVKVCEDLSLSFLKHLSQLFLPDLFLHFGHPRVL